MDKKLLLSQDKNNEWGIVMKQILTILFALQILFCPVGMAFEPPSGDRWFWIGSTDKIGCWIDIQSMDFRIESMYPHKGHKQVDLWALVYNAERDDHSKQRTVYDLTCKKYKTTSVISYDKNNRITNSFDTSYRDYESVIPETFTEAIYEFCNAVWDYDPRNKNK